MTDVKTQAPEDILAFWLEEVGPDGWYKGGVALDTEITRRFLTTWEAACEGALSAWLSSPAGVLAYLIVVDQFPRNMFRGQARAFASDKAALAVAKCAVDKGWDMKVAEPARQFFYTPMMHSESLCDQERCVRLMKERMGDSGAGNMLHAKVHREVIRRFGRFPYRNAALSRTTTAPEAAFVAQGGYGAVLQELSAV